MICAMLKREDKLTVKLEGDGPTGPIVADANAKGQARAYITHPHVDFDLNEQGKLDVRRAVGTNGSLSVVKDLGLKEHFTGQVPIVSGEVSEDFTYYFTSTKQHLSVVATSVLPTTDQHVLASGGFIIQVMPGATDDTIDYIEKRVNRIQSISSMIQAAKKAEDIFSE